MSLPYSALAECYDRLNDHVDYHGWANGLAAKMKALGTPDGALVLDLACGTGNITLPLAALGYDMIGVDLSPDMLNAARQKKGADKVLWLCQDMRAFELYGTVGAVVCCLDSINYLTGRIGLRKCFSLVHNYLDPDGIFLFDVNSPYKFKHIYGDQQYVLDAEGIYCGWKNFYDEESGICDFELTIFSEGEDGLWHRFDENQRERCWSVKTLSSLLIACGFEVLEIASDLDGTPVGETSERIFFTCRAIKS
ncbi:MAG: class I SAM-dependent methyltransferase [Ruminococcaceae bacterium]|nr:class I SAM-dependent methyltransferase [Oscillospiraceae bacterium]